MIHEEICTYEVCKLAKERRFNVPTAEFYNDDGYIGCYPRAFNHNEFPDGDYAAPTQSLLQRWLREEKGLILIIRFDPSEQMYDWGVFLETQPIEFTSSEEYFEKYELALENAIKFALENLV